MIDDLVADEVTCVAPGLRPRVTVTVEPVDPGTVGLTVAEDGIGIPMPPEAARW